MLPLRGGDTVPEPLQPTEDAVPCAVARSPLSPAASRLLGPHQTSQVGKWSERQYAPEPVERGAIRRFAQAIMDPDPWYADDAAAQAGRFGQIVAPPLFPLHALRRAAGTPDPLSAAVADPHFDGFGQLSTILGLESLDLPLKRFLNGGSDHTMFSLARMGERISVLSRYEDLYVKDGKDGPLVFAVIHSRFEAEAPAAAGRRPLLSTRQTYVWR